MSDRTFPEGKKIFAALMHILYTGETRRARPAFLFVADTDIVE